MKVLTCDEMRAADRAAIDMGVPAAVLMENAAIAVVAEALKLKPKKARIFAGGGQNGGDGFAVARHLYNRGIDTEIVCLFDEEKLRAAAKINYDAARAFGIPLIKLSQLREECDLIIDAIYGIGFHGEAEGEAALAIDIINSSKAYVISVDLPSGVYCDSGGVSSHAVRSDKTVAMGFVKPAHVIWPAAGCAGDVVVADISLPPYPHGSLYTIEKDDAKAAFPALSGDCHKGRLGHGLVVAGSMGMCGAAYLATEGALRGGAGLVTAAVPNDLIPIMSARLTGAMCAPATPELVAERAEKAQSVCIGPGLGNTDDTLRLIKTVLRSAKGTVVIDADGLNALSGNMDILNERNCEVILTPHPGEMARLVGTDVSDIQKNRLSFAKSLSDKYNITVVLKGAGTIVAFPGEGMYINITGTPAMARGGSGDILAGFIAGIAARGTPPAVSARAGVYLHGRAGEIASGGRDYALTADGLLNALIPAINEL